MTPTIILQQEAHPDRCTEAVIGPYASFELALDVATALEASPSNYWPHGGKRSHFNARELTRPEDVA